MVSLFIIFTITFLLNYVLITCSIKFINNVNDENIVDKKVIRILVSVFSGAAVWFLYVKYSWNIFFLRYALMMLFLTIIGYLDAYTHSIYNFIVYIFLAVGIIFQLIDIFYYYGDINSLLIGVVGSLAVSCILAAVKQLGWGDVEVFFVISLYITGFLSVFNVFLSFALSGLYSIPKILLKKLDLNDESALGPFITISSFLVLIIYF